MWGDTTCPLLEAWPEPRKLMVTGARAPAAGVRERRSHLRPATGCACRSLPLLVRPRARKRRCAFPCAGDKRRSRRLRAASAAAISSCSEPSRVLPELRVCDGRQDDAHQDSVLSILGAARTAKPGSQGSRACCGEVCGCILVCNAPSFRHPHRGHAVAKDHGCSLRRIKAKFQGHSTGSLGTARGARRQGPRDDSKRPFRNAQGQQQVCVLLA
jgi:hypothetical protein